MVQLEEESIDRVIQMAWEDRTPFEAIEMQFGLSEADTIKLMRNQLKRSSFRRWRKHVQGRKTKHAKLRSGQVNRFKCSRQKAISYNSVPKKR